MPLCDRVLDNGLAAITSASCTVELLAGKDVPKQY